MITVPDRIGAAIAQIEQGEQVDWRKLGDLQALDLVVAGQRFAEEAAKRDADFDDLSKQQVEQVLQ